MVDPMAQQGPTDISSDQMTGKDQAINEFVEAQFQSIALSKQFNNT